ncbi:hypothetical protein P7C70_g6281, partial [Phenoliferia sp. Uapishka_3]
MVISKYSCPLVVVAGATGLQGGSVIRHLIASDKPYRIRAITRDRTQKSAIDLLELGVQLFVGDIAVEGDIEVALMGAHYFFVRPHHWKLFSFLMFYIYLQGVTPFYEGDNEKEIAEGKNLVRAAKTAGVKLFAWSGAVSPEEVSGGKYTGLVSIENKFTRIKATTAKFAKEVGLPTVVVASGFYATNFIILKRMFVKQSDGSYTLIVPVPSSTTISIIDVEEDYGAYVRAGIESPAFGAGTFVRAASDEISFDQIAASISKASGKKVVAKQVSDEDFAAKFDSRGKRLTSMFHYFEDFGVFGGKDIGPSQSSLAGSVRTFADFAKGVKWEQVLIEAHPMLG